MDVKIIQMPVTRWKEYKSLRLDALTNSPFAFANYPEEEAIFPDKKWQERLESPNDFKVFAEVNGNLIGKMEVIWDLREKVKHSAELYGVYIQPAFRKMGITRMLLQEVEKIAKTKGIEKLTLDANITQEDAIQAYQKLGFRIIGTKEKEMKIHGKYYDKLLMEKFI